MKTRERTKRKTSEEFILVERCARFIVRKESVVQDAIVRASSSLGKVKTQARTRCSESRETFGNKRRKSGVEKQKSIGAKWTFADEAKLCFRRTNSVRKIPTK